MPFCRELNESDGCVDLLPTCRKCRYHAHPASIPFTQLAPEGLCLEAFHSVFPLGFAMFSAPRGRLADHVEGCCPAGEVIFNLYRRPFLKLRHLPRQILNLLAAPFFATEVLRWRIMIRVEQVGACPYGYSTGDEFEINLGHRREICPAAAHSFFPFFMEEIFGHSRTAPMVSCPDHKTDVRALVGPIPEDAVGRQRTCRDMSGVAIEILDPGGESMFAAGDRFEVSELLQKVNVPCLSYINAMGPYYRVACEGGKLGFYTRTYRSAIIQCPCVESKVVTRVEKHPSDSSFSITVLDTKDQCPLGMNTGTRHVLTADSQSLFWTHALACLSPYLINSRMANGHDVAFSFPTCARRPTVMRIHAAPVTQQSAQQESAVGGRGENSYETGAS